MRKPMSTRFFLIPPVGRTYYLRLCLALAISSLATLTAALTYGGGAEVLYQTLGGGAFASGGGAPSMLALLVCGVPPLAMCYLFSDFFREGLSHAASLFTRTTARGSWLGWRVLQLGGFVVAYTLLTSALSALIAFVVGAPDTSPSSLNDVAGFLLPAAGLNSLMLLVLLIPLNVASVRANPVGCFVVVMGVYFISLLICASLPQSVATPWVMWLPSTQGVFAWHDVSQALASAQGAIGGFALLHSYGYLLVLAFIESGASAAYIRRLELY